MKRDYIYIIIIVVLVVALIITLSYKKASDTPKEEDTKKAIITFIAINENASDHIDFSQTFEKLIDNENISITNSNLDTYTLTYKCNELSDKNCLEKTNALYQDLIEKINLSYKFDSVSIVDKANILN